MKKHKIRKTIAAALVMALSSALLSGYSYPAEKAARASETNDSDPKLYEEKNENGFVEVNMFSGRLKCGNTTIARGPQPDCSVWHGTPIYQYSQNETGPYSEALPDTLGTWYVRVVVEEDEEYYRFESAPVSFKVKEENGWISHRGDTYRLECADTTIIQGPLPTCKMQHGMPVYQYSKNEAGPYSEALPDTLGTWYVRAVVEEDEEYYRFESAPVSFKVSKADNRWVKGLSILDITFGEEPGPDAEAAHGTVTYRYSQSREGGYTNVPPVFPGRWYVKAIVEEDDTYNVLESAPVEFVVRAANEWTEQLSMSDITFGETPAPNASAVHGTVKYQYSQSEAGPYTDELPNAIGIWYVKAIVEESTTYNELVSEPVGFEVKKDGNEWERELTISNIALRETPEPKAGALHGAVTYYYSQSETGPYTNALPNARGTWYVKAVVAAGDTYDGLESAPVSFEVGKMKNAWTKELTMFDVILGDKPEPKAGVAHGTVNYQYSRNEEGPYSDALPDVPGTWYVKAIVAENETYAPLESEPTAFVLIDLDKYVPPLVEPDNTDKPEEKENSPAISGRPEHKVEKAGNTVMTPTDATEKESEKNADDAKSKAVNKSMNTVQTGDHTSVTAYLLLLGCGFVLALMMLRKNRSTNSDKN